VASAGVSWAFEQYVLYCLKRRATLARDLIWCVFGVEALRECTCKRMSGDYPEEGAKMSSWVLS
jgi:hypothetical protein